MLHRGKPIPPPPGYRPARSKRALPQPGDPTLAGRMSELIARSFPEVGSGVRTDRRSGTVQVFVTADADDLLTAIRAMAPPGRSFSVSVVPHSYAEQRRVMDRLTADKPVLAEAGVHRISWGPAPERGAVRVGVRRPTDDDLRALSRALGAVQQLTIDDYRPAAARYLDGRYGAGRTFVDDHFHSPARRLPGRRYPTPT